MMGRLRISTGFAWVFIAALFAETPVLSDFGQAQKMMNQSDCMACHALDQKLVGPAFKEIAAKYTPSPETINALTKSVKEGSSGKWGNIPMTPHPALSEKQIRAMIEGILSLTAEMKHVKETEQIAIQKASPKDIARGRDLFQGKLRFKNRGAACNSCHHVKNDAVIGGGILAKDLTSAFSRLGKPGVMAILGSPPFPVMERAYRENPLEGDEIYALVSFLHFADQERAYQSPKDYGMGLFISGILGAALIFLFFSFVGTGRKKKSVYGDIFDRQIKSQ